MLYKTHVPQFFIFMRMWIMIYFNRNAPSLHYINKYKNGYLDLWQANFLLKQYDMKIDSRGEMIE